MKFFAFLSRHKTKITGMLLTALGSLQANSQTIQSFVSPKEFAYLTIVLGLLVACIGFLNSSRGS